MYQKKPLFQIFSQKKEEDIRPKNEDRPKLKIVQPAPVQTKVVQEPEFKQEDIIIGQYKKHIFLLKKKMD